LILRRTAIMGLPYLNLFATPAVGEAQRRFYGKTVGVAAAAPPEPLGEDERAFITSRDSFYLATVTETGWPYMQHRGGPPGFLRVLGPRTIGFADLRGNRQLLSTGNLAANDRVSLFLMDYPQRSRLKLAGHARVVAAAEQPEVERALRVDGQNAVERLFLIDVIAFDWNCPKHITPRYTQAEIDEVIAPLHRRIAELETKLTASRHS
jgi:uncharacterized protein